MRKTLITSIASQLFLAALFAVLDPNVLQARPGDRATSAPATQPATRPATGGLLEHAPINACDVAQTPPVHHRLV